MRVMLGEVIDLVSGIAMGEPGDKAKHILAAFTNILRNGTVE